MASGTHHPLGDASPSLRGRSEGEYEGVSSIPIPSHRPHHQFHPIIERPFRDHPHLVVMQRAQCVAVFQEHFFGLLRWQRPYQFLVEPRRLLLQVHIFRRLRPGIQPFDPAAEEIVEILEEVRVVKGRALVDGEGIGNCKVSTGFVILRTG